MTKYYVCLLDSEWNGETYNRGCIVIAESGTGPPSVAWANFDPLTGLEGTPALMHTEDNGRGDLIFRYSIAESKMRFILRARVGLPQAYVEIERGRKSPARDTGHLKSSKKIKLEYGAGPAMTSGRSFVGWTGRSRPVSVPRVEKDLLRDGLEEDLLRKGM